MLKEAKVSDEIHTEENPNPDNQGNPPTDEPINLTYMNNCFRVFLSCPLFVVVPLRILLEVPSGSEEIPYTDEPTSRWTQLLSQQNDFV